MFEILVVGVLCVLIATAWRQGRRARLASDSGGKLIIGGLVLLLVGALVDVSDHFPQLNRFVVLGQTPTQAFVEKVICFIGGFALIAVGVGRWLPMVAERARLEEALREERDDLERRLREGSEEISAQTQQLQIEALQREQATSALRQSEELLDQVVAGAPLLLLASDPRGRVSMARGRALAAIGVDETAVIGQVLFDALPSYETVRRDFARALAGRSTEASVHLTDREFQLRHSPWLAEDGELLGVTTLGIDVTARARAQRELDRFFSLSANLLCTLDLEGRFQQLSPAFETRLGYRQAELLNRHLIDFVHPDDRQQMAVELESLGPQTEAIETEVRLLLNNGDYRWFEWIARLDPVDGACYSVAHDVTEVKATQRELRQLKDAAEEASQAKSSFLANMSHELRSPLNSVIGFANVLGKNRKGNLEPQDLQYLDRIRANGEHLLSLINEVLDLSKVEAGRVEVSLGLVELPSLIAETVAQLGGDPESDTVSLRLEVPNDVRPIESDAMKLKQVLINLVSNALKFTEQGEVLVRLVANPATGAPQRIDVVDTGIGIPDERLARIFDAFHQVDSSRARQHGGTGLGLSISRNLCQLLGYHLHATSRIGRGSTFTIDLTPRSVGQQRVSLVRREREVEDSPATARREAAERLNGRRIAVINGDPESRAELIRVVETLGCRVVAAAAGRDGLAIGADPLPDAILLDLELARDSGLETLAGLKAEPRVCEIPVIVVSLLADERREALPGAAAVVRRPVARSELGGALVRVLESPAYRVLVVDDDPDHRKILGEHLADLNVEIHEALDGRQALDSLDAARPDVVVFDLEMPVLDGRRFLKAVRSDPRFQDLPVIVVTGRDLGQDETTALLVDAAAVVQKGDALGGELRAVVSRLLSRPASGVWRTAI